MDFFVLDMCSKPIFCSKVAQKGKICSRLPLFLEPPKFAQKLTGAIENGLNTSREKPFGKLNA